MRRHTSVRRPPARADAVVVHEEGHSHPLRPAGNIPPRSAALCLSHSRRASPASPGTPRAPRDEYCGRLPFSHPVFILPGTVTPDGPSHLQSQLRSL